MMSRRMLSMKCSRIIQRHHYLLLLLTITLSLIVCGCWALEDESSAFRELEKEFGADAHTDSGEIHAEQLLGDGAYDEDEDDDLPSNDLNDNDQPAESFLAVDETGKEIEYESPKYDAKQFHFVDSFDNVAQSQKMWVKSEARKDDTAEEIAKYDGEWSWEPPQRLVYRKDNGLVMKSKAKHSAISARLQKPYVFEDDKVFVVQYEVTLQEGQDCGGAYIKLLSQMSPEQSLQKFNDKTPYTIMFGPDKCGNDVKMHFIFRHVNPLNGTITEKHCTKPKERLDKPFNDKLPHLYRLTVKPDNTFTIQLDHKVIKEGSLLQDFEPAVNPPHEIDDPNDAKPEDWDEREKIPDPNAVKPDDWNEDAPAQIRDTNAVMPQGWLEDEPAMIPDPSAIKPEDWDADMDGEWEPPLIDNPVCEKAPGCGKWEQPLIANKDYKGKWRAPLIDNPEYKGKWSPRKIVNPHFFEDLTPFKMTTISAVGIEIWSMSNNILFDNLIITDDEEVADEFAAKTYDIKRRYIEKKSKTLWHRLMRHINYKPGWWALYFLYLILPISIYIYYLQRRFKEESVVSTVTSYFKHYPWLWAVVIAFVTIPCYCLASKLTRKDTNTTAAPAEVKKTDAPQPDVQPEEQTSTTANGGEEGNNGNDVVIRSSHRVKKSDLNSRVGEEEVMNSDEQQLLELNDDVEELNNEENTKIPGGKKEYENNVADTDEKDSSEERGDGGDDDIENISSAGGDASASTFTTTKPRKRHVRKD